MTASGAIEVVDTGAKAEALARQADLATKRVQHREAALTAFVNSTLATLQAVGLGQSIMGIAPTQGDSLTASVARGMQATVQAALRDSKIAITVVDSGEKLTPGSTTASTASTAPASQPGRQAGRQAALHQPKTSSRRTPHRRPWRSWHRAH